MTLAVLIQASENIMGMQKGGLEEPWVYNCSPEPSTVCVPDSLMLYEKSRKAFGRLVAVLTCWDYRFWPEFLEVLQLVQEKWDELF